MSTLKRSDATHDPAIGRLWMEQIGNAAMGRTVDLTPEGIATQLSLPVWFVRCRIDAIVEDLARYRIEAERMEQRATLSLRQTMRIVARQCEQTIIESPVRTESEARQFGRRSVPQYALKPSPAYRDHGQRQAV